MMRIAEEFLLLLRDEDGGAVSGPRMADPLRPRRRSAHGIWPLENRIDTDARRLFLIDSSPLGDALLDPMLSEDCRKRAGSTTPSTGWSTRPTMPTKSGKRHWRGLVENGVLRTQRQPCPADIRNAALPARERRSGAQSDSADPRDAAERYDPGPERYSDRHPCAWLRTRRTFPDRRRDGRRRGTHRTGAEFWN